MKLLIISDIHCNIFALNAIWEKESDSDVVCCAGDIVDISPNAKEVINWLKDHKAITILGNHDSKLVKYHNAIISGEKQQQLKDHSWLSYNYSTLSKDEIHFLETRPITTEFVVDSYLYGMKHAYKRYHTIQDNEKYKNYSLEKFGRHVDRMIFGHTHYQGVGELNDGLWINPGSVSYNRNEYLNSLNAFYAVVEDGKIFLKNTKYDTKAFFSEMESLSGTMGRRALRRMQKFFLQKNK